MEVTAKILLAKGGESSGFIRDDVEKALTAMVCSLTPTRVLVALISGGARFVIRVKYLSSSSHFWAVLSLFAETVGTKLAKMELG